MIIPAEADSINDAARLLAAGEIVAFPTETVYALGADSANPDAVAKIFAAKDRPHFKPLISHAADISLLRTEALFDDRADRLAAHFWPGPLTLVLNKHPSARGASITHAGLPSISVRIPAHPVALAMLEEFARISSGLVAAPSANRSNMLSPTTAQHVAASLGGRAPFILDGGRTGVGVESTIIDLTGDVARVLRPGGLALESIEALIGPCARAAPGDKPIAPGMLARHYAPKKPMRLNATHATDDEAFLLFGSATANFGGRLRLNLSESGDAVEAAANLFDHLHWLELSDVAAIAVMPIPDIGLGVAINDCQSALKTDPTSDVLLVRR